MAFEPRLHEGFRLVGHVGVVAPFELSDFPIAEKPPPDDGERGPFRMKDPIDVGVSFPHPRGVTRDAVSLHLALVDELGRARDRFDLPGDSWQGRRLEATRTMIAGLDELLDTPPIERRHLVVDAMKAL